MILLIKNEIFLIFKENFNEKKGVKLYKFQYIIRNFENECVLKNNYTCPSCLAQVVERSPLKQA